MIYNRWVKSQEYVIHFEKKWIHVIIKQAQTTLTSIPNNEKLICSIAFILICKCMEVRTIYHFLVFPFITNIWTSSTRLDFQLYLRILVNSKGWGWSGGGGRGPSLHFILAWPNQIQAQMHVRTASYSSGCLWKY